MLRDEFEGANARKLRCPLAIMLLLVMSFSACAVMPSAGPSRKVLLSSTASEDGGPRIIKVNEAVAKATRTNSQPNFPESFFLKELVDISVVNPGDTLHITVWENIDNGIFVNEAGDKSNITSHEISEDGTFFFPYAGTLSAAGKTTEQIRLEITDKLAGQTPDPQVQVAHRLDSLAGITIYGDSKVQGLVPFNKKNRTLKAMLASKGALIGNPGTLNKIVLIRNGITAELYANDLIKNNKYDVPLRYGDEVSIRADDRFFRVMGDNVKPLRASFRRKEISALDALIENGGLDPKKTNISGILVIRDENRVFGDSIQSNTSPLRTAYVLNLREPDGVWIADMFEIRSGDIVYVSQAPLVAWMKPMEVVFSALRGVDQVSKTAKRF